MRRSHALFLLVLLGVAATSTSFASASGQCTKPPSGGGEKAKNSGCGAVVDGGADAEVEIIKMSSINFEKTIAGEVGEPEDSVTLVLFEGEEKRPAVSAAFRKAAAALEGLGVQAATVNSVADLGLAKAQGGGSGKTAVRAFFSTLQGLRDSEKEGGERRPTNVAAGGEPLVSEGEGEDGPLADANAIAAVALEAVAAAAASRLGGSVGAPALLLGRSSAPSSTSSCSCSSKKGKDASSSCSSCSKKKKEKDEKEKKKAKEEEEKAKKNAKKEEEKKKDSKKKKSAAGGSKKKKMGGRVNEGGGYFSSSPDIDALGDSTFDANVLSADSKATMVMFYAPWCGHCKQLAPDYERLPQLLLTKHGNPDARVAAVDCDKHKQACSRQGVQGFPTLKFFKAGPGSSAEDYRGPRDAESLAAFIAERAPKRPAEIVELTDNDVLQESCPPEGNSAGLLSAEEAAALPRLCLFAFVPDLRDSSAKERNSLLNELKKVAAEFAGRPYFISWASGGAHSKIEDAFSLGYGFPALVAYIPPDAVRGKDTARAVHLKGKFDAKSIVSFVERVRGGGGGGAVGVDPRKVVAAEPGSVAPWDGNDVSEDSAAAGKDASEEFSLADLGLDLPSAGKDEL